MSPTRPLSLLRFLLAAAATLALCVAGTLALPHDPYIRYQSFKGSIFERLDWIYERIHFDPTPIDVAFIGSSRTARGAVPTLIEAELAERGHDLRVVNFSLPAAGLDVRFTEARELLETRDVELLVISLVEALPRDGHQAFAELARVDEILTSPWIVNRNLPRNLAKLPVRQIKLFAATLAPEGFGYRAAFDPALYRGATIDSRIFAGDPETAARPVLRDMAAHRARLEAETRRRRREITPPVLPESLSWIEFGASRSYIRRIVALAEAHGTRVAFLFLPFYQGYEAPIEEGWIAQFGPVWNARFLREDAVNYADAAHASDAAAPLLADWLAARIVETLDVAPGDGAVLHAGREGERS